MKKKGPKIVYEWIHVWCMKDKWSSGWIMYTIIQLTKNKIFGSSFNQKTIYTSHKINETADIFGIPSIRKKNLNIENRNNGCNNAIIVFVICSYTNFLKHNKNYKINFWNSENKVEIVNPINVSLTFTKKNKQNKQKSI